MPPAGSAVQEVQGALRATYTSRPAVVVAGLSNDFAKCCFHRRSSCPPDTKTRLTRLYVTAALIFSDLSKPSVLVPSRVWKHSSVQVAVFWHLHKVPFDQQEWQSLLLCDAGSVSRILKRYDGGSHYTSVENRIPTVGPDRYC